MLLKDFIPAPDVSGFVELYRIVHLQFAAGETLHAKAYPPRPEHCIAFYPYDRETVRYQHSDHTISNIPVVLYGQSTQVNHRSIGQNFLVLQVIFRPGAIFRLTGIPATELTDQYIDATSVFGKSLNDINQQLYEAADYSAMITIANSFARSLIKRSRLTSIPLDHTFGMMFNTHEKIKIDELAALSCLGNRQFSRKFKERTGVSPKTYERIIRFDKTFRFKNSNPTMDWLRIAVEFDYHDYQHLSKDYQDFTGSTPNVFHQVEDQAPERRLGLLEGYSPTNRGGDVGCSL